MTRLWQRFVNRLMAWWRGHREIEPTSLTTESPVIGAPTLTINPKTKRKLAHRPIIRDADGKPTLGPIRWISDEYDMSLVDWVLLEVAVQYHVPAKDHINNHPYVLHWWRPRSKLKRIPMPPKNYV